MDLLIVGINHQTAPVALREKVAFTPDQIGHALNALGSLGGIRELAILSTCNRTEIICVTTDQNPEPVQNWLAEYHHLPLHDLAPNMYSKTGTEAVAHTMRVAAGLDSMVLGEPQILGQVKDCFNLAQAHDAMGAELNKLSQSTFNIAKHIRTHTGIGENSVSVASTSVTLASQLFADLKTCNALLIGAGETVELVGRHLNAAGIKALVIANRTLANAEYLAAELGGQATDLAGIPFHLIDTDILIASTASQLPILGKGAVERALKQRRHKPIFMVDLAVPRDIEPEVGELRDVYLYSIDDLNQIIDTNLTGREGEAARAEEMISDAVKRYVDDRQSRRAVSALVRFRQKNEAFKTAELDKAIQRLKNGEDPEVLLRALANQLTNKIIHTPSIQLKQAGKEGRHDLLAAIEEVFQLSDD